MSQVISDKDFMTTYQKNSRVKSDLDNKDDPLTEDCISLELDAVYKKICKKYNDDPENEMRKKGKRRNNYHGTALAASGNGLFKERCYVCKNWGHKSNQCPFKNNGITQKGQNT